MTSASSGTTWSDRATIIGYDIAFCAYGVHATLFFLCLSYFWSQRKSNPRHTYVWMGYITALFVLGSIANAMDMRMGQVIFVDNRHYPGGPWAFMETTYTVPVNVVCCVIGGWLMDGLLIYRFNIIVSPPKWMLAIPIVMFLVCVAMSLLLVAQLAHPGSNIWDRNNMNVELAYWCTSIAVNILLTALIVAHLLRMRRRVIKKAAGTSIQLPYLSISTMLIEAASLYTALGLAFLILNATGRPANVLFFSWLGQIQFITPLLIILRVAQGRAYPAYAVPQAAATMLRWANQPTASSRYHSVRLGISSTGTNGHLIIKPFTAGLSYSSTDPEKGTTFLAMTNGTHDAVPVASQPNDSSMTPNTTNTNAYFPEL
ncbi:hypothetical protein EIP91_010373 [Steccherinum ochraceum]|uniref:Uncharacterized protein n=1 Tax=Steccherinum ochraceum TaxID=92696 RepID=A0A4R0RZC5_9APHY|nr:hypothetical protein EIP91_010373 [Steccherinum ochraceum]